jgi:tetratricopeptide (TPR) repeat protein
MKNVSLLLLIILASIQFTSAQVKGTANKGKALSAAETQQILNQLDSAVLPEIRNDACKCIDSISLTNKDYKDISADIKKCIDKQVYAYDMLQKLILSSKDAANKTININVDVNSSEYQECYHKIENNLRDSCSSLKKALASNDTHHNNSVSSNRAAIDEYNKGVAPFENDDYKTALPHFLKAVNIDPVFAFAWDDIGKCYRNLGDYDKAIDAYNESLALDPKGETPLQNIPIAYEFKKEYDQEIKAYERFLAIYPDDPEVYFGLGKVYMYYKNDTEKGLDNMCKALNIYTKVNSPYRVDAEKIIANIYGQMKKDGKEDIFNKILKDNNINIKQ